LYENILDLKSSIGYTLQVWGPGISNQDKYRSGPDINMKLIGLVTIRKMNNKWVGPSLKFSWMGKSLAC